VAAVLEKTGDSPTQTAPFRVQHDACSREHRRMDPFDEARRALLRGCSDSERAAHVVFLAMPRVGTADLFGVGDLVVADKSLSEAVAR
jgi:hypothetical protein